MCLFEEEIKVFYSFLFTSKYFLHFVLNNTIVELNIFTYET